ncbi:MAG: RlmI/RlmK family 23S rRNA methyltransferase [Oleiphilus sp.]|nr:MAG: RlmI/RlmK family 23S rRNA methyltransferase [Oleiphilus sp.]
MSYNSLILNAGAEKRLKQGHLWIYSNEVDNAKSPLKSFEAGEQCVVLAASGKAVGTALISPHALICGRLISRDATQFLDRSLFVHRIKIALSLRERVFPKPYYRLIYGDSDALPGLVVDRYGSALVVQIASAGMEKCKDEIVEALVKVLKPEVVLFKNNGKMRAMESLDSYVEFALGNADEVELEENGTRFIAPIVHGQKTGWFYDHRMNRARLTDYVKDKRVLDLFSYVGGWGIQAAARGAESVVCVDSSSLALDFAERNATLNGLNNVNCVEGDVFDVCQAFKVENQRFDVIIADPPAFIARRKDQKAGEKAYQKLYQLAMRLLSKDGILIAGSCSMHMHRDRMREVLRNNGQTLEKQVQILEQGGQGPDHPVHPSIVETDYLKAMFCRVLPAR